MITKSDRERQILICGFLKKKQQANNYKKKRDSQIWEQTSAYWRREKGGGAI